jgi:NagD protein
VLTPAVVGAEVIRERYGDRPVLAFGGPGLVDVLAAAGVNLRPGPHRAAAVVIGWDTAFGQEQLQRAAEALWAGADLFVTSDAGRFASSRGPLAGVAGFISSGLAHVTGQRYEVLGKPSAAAMSVAARRLGVPADRILVAGDDLTLEARMARGAGAVAVLITTGLHGEPEAAAAPPADRPDLVLGGLPDLMALWEKADALHLDGVA